MPRRFSLQHPLTRFFAVLLAVYAVWFVVYDLWLLPAGRLDAWLSHGVAAWAGGILHLLGADVFTSGRVIRVGQAAGVLVADGCNGLSTLGLFAGFVLAYPGSWKRRAWFLPLGLALVVLANVLRVVALAAIQPAWPGAFDFMHSFAVSTFFYVVVFGLWVVWANVGGSPPVEQKVVAERAQPARVTA